MTREEYNKRAAARKKKSIIIKSSLGLAAFFMFAGIHSVRGLFPHQETISLMRMEKHMMYPDSRADPK